MFLCYLLCVDFGACFFVLCCLLVVWLVLVGCWLSDVVCVWLLLFDVCCLPFVGGCLLFVVCC